ncbi:MAG: 4Fe-4S binding protein [Planctomycetota bacterium]
MSMSQLQTTPLERRQPSPPTRRQDQQGYDLLRFRPVKAIVLWGGFPYVFQAVLLVVFVAMAVFAWGIYPPEAVSDKLYAKSHLVNLVVWGLWWPAMVWIAVLFGRVWCAVCPLELVANGTERLGRVLGISQRKLGKWLRAGWLIVVVYALIQMSVAGVQLHRIPAHTSMFLWSLLAAAALVGFFFRDRAFCRGFCPVGLLLGTYGRGAMLAVRPTSGEKCASCTGKDCVRACNRTKVYGRGCPSLLNPARLDNNNDCLVCGECVKACEPDNMGVFLRRPFPAADAREPLASWPVVLFVMLVSGFVTYELFSEWKAAQAMFLWSPAAVTNALGADAHEGWIKGVWTLFVVPLVLWLVLGGLVLLFRGAESMSEAWRRLALPLAIVIAVGHMSKGLAKIVSWGGFLPLSAKDPVGIDTARAITAETLPPPGALLPMVAVSLIAVLMMLAGTGYALRELRLAQGETTHRRYLAPILVLASAFLFLVFGWGFLQ